MNRDLDTTRDDRGQTQDGGTARNIVLGIDIDVEFGIAFLIEQKQIKFRIQHQIWR